MNNRPILAAPSYAQSVVAAQSQDFGKPALDAGSPTRTAGAILPVVTGMAIIDVAGVILHRTGQLNPTYGATGLDGLQFKLQSALADDTVRGVLFNINSGGGQVSGLFDFVDLIHAADKPTWAIIDETGASAAFAVASAADRVLIPQTGMAGGIGVVLAHIDQSKRLEQQGLSVTLIHSGQHKVDGNGYQPLSDGVKADLQKEVDQLYSLFTKTVARNRGLAESKVRGTEARLFTGQDAVRAGLADRVMPAHDVLGEFSAHLRGQRTGTRTARTASAPQPARSMDSIAAKIYATQ